jgi:uncharacterized membrane protein YedE/YeeE
MHGFAGGMLIGLSAVLLMLWHGRIAGISGMVSGLVTPRRGDWQWRLVFLCGLLLAALLFQLLDIDAPFSDRRSPAWMVIVAGALVGAGTRMGNGCTSGHGVCGLARLSVRSFVAVLTFLASAMLTVFLVRHVIAGMP